MAIGDFCWPYRTARTFTELATGRFARWRLRWAAELRIGMLRLILHRSTVTEPLALYMRVERKSNNEREKKDRGRDGGSFLQLKVTLSAAKRECG